MYVSATNVITDLATANGGVLNTSATGVPSVTATPVLGLVGTLGTLGFSGSTSGVVTVRPAAAAGTWAMTLPTSAGTANQVLQTDGTGITSWATPAGYACTIQSVSANTTVSAALCQTLLVSAASGSVTITLFSAVINTPGSIVYVKKTDSTINNVIVSAPAIDSTTSLTLGSQNSSLMLQSNATQWWSL